jgi:hypothetical protein
MTCPKCNSDDMMNFGEYDACMSCEWDNLPELEEKPSLVYFKTPRALREYQLIKNVSTRQLRAGEVVFDDEVE